MNTIYVSGLLEKEPEVKNVENGYLLTFDMAHSEGFTSSEGTEKSHTTKWRVSKFFENEPKAVLRKLQKGIKVLIQGQPNIQYMEHNGKVHMDYSIVSQKLDILSRNEVAVAAS